MKGGLSRYLSLTTVSMKLGDGFSYSTRDRRDKSEIIKAVHHEFRGNIKPIFLTCVL